MSRPQIRTALVIVAPLNTEDAPAVRDLLVAGLTERWGKYEPKFNPDVEAFPASDEGMFVLVAKQAGVVVGTGTLRTNGAGKAEIVRMSVAASNRRSGIGSLILKRLLRLAQEQGVKEVRLETTSSWSSAIRFYVQHGFVQTHEEGGDSHFLFRLGDA